MTNSPNTPSLTRGADGVARASSLEVAERFGKRHDNVLRTIETLISMDKNTHLKFEVSEYQDSTGRMLRCMLMDRTTFCVLASKLPGESALEWSIKFVQAFDDMESALRGSPLVLPNARELARLVIAAEDRADAEAAARLLSDQRAAEQTAIAAAETHRADHNKAVAPLLSMRFPLIWPRNSPWWSATRRLQRR